MFVKLQKYLDALAENSRLILEVEKYKISNEIRDSKHYEEMQEREKGWVTDAHKNKLKRLERERDDALLKYKVLASAHNTKTV